MTTDQSRDENDHGRASIAEAAVEVVAARFGVQASGLATKEPRQTERGWEVIVYQRPPMPGGYYVVELDGSMDVISVKPGL